MTPHPTSHSPAVPSSRPPASSEPHAALTHSLVRRLGNWAVPGIPLHGSLADRLRALVVAGELPAGARLPSERVLANKLGVSRNTVAAAFEGLRSEGVLTSRQGSGTYVSSAGLYTRPRGDHRLSSFDARAGSAMVDLRSAAPGGLSMVTSAFSQIDLDALATLVAGPGYVPGGLPELGAEVARYYDGLGVPTTPDQILITSGAQQALQLVASCLLEQGAQVAVEDPTFRGAIEVLRAAGARLLPVPSGADGMDVGALSSVIRARRPELVLVQSTVHNPTGSVLPEAERSWLVNLTARHGIALVDDIAPMDTLIDGELPTPLACHGDSVITIGSASKAFWGGLRVGWLRARPALIARLASVKGGSDLGTSLVAQALTARLLRQVGTARQQRRRELGAARTLLHGLLAEQLPDWRPLMPQGGGSMMVRLPVRCATQLAQLAERAGVLVLPGPTFSCVDGLDDHVRISYAVPDDEIREGVTRLAGVWHRRSVSHDGSG